MNFKHPKIYKILIAAFWLKVLISIVLGGIFLFNISYSKAEISIDQNFKQVKTPDSPVVYYIDYNLGQKKAYLSEKAYFSYGNAWSEVKIVDSRDLDSFKNAYLIKTKEEPAVYYIQGDKKALVPNEKTFNEYGFKWSEIMTVSQEDLDSYKNIKFGFGGAHTAYFYNSEVKVNLDISSPDTYFLPLNTRDNLVAVYNFESERGIVEIKNLYFKLNGVFDQDAITMLRIRDLDNQNYSAEANLKNGQARFNLIRDPLTLVSGQSKKIGVYIDLTSAGNVENTNFRISLDSYESVNTSAWVSGNFPIFSSQVNLADGKDSLGQADISKINLGSQELIIGNSASILGKFRISETSNKEALLVKELVFKNAGTARKDELSDLKLKNNANRVISESGYMNSNNEIVFKVEGYQIGKNTYDNFFVYADILQGEGKTVDLKLKSIRAVGATNGYITPANINNYSEILEIKREFLGVASLPLKANSKVFKEYSGTIAGLFEIRSDKQDVKIKSIDVSLEKSVNAIDLINTIYLINYDNGEVINYVNGINAGDLTSFSMDDYKLEERKELKLALVTEIPENAINNSSYKITINRINYRASNNTFYSDEVNTGGDALVLSRSRVYIYPNNEEVDEGYTRGEEKAKIASFILEATSGEDTIINSLSLSRGSTSGSLTFDNGFSNIRIYLGSKKISEIIERPFSDTYHFEGFNYKLQNGKRVELKVYADLDKNLRASEANMKITQISAAGKDSGMRTVVSGINTVSNTVSFGDLDIELTASGGGAITVGEKNNVIASFKIRNNSEEIVRLKYLTIRADGSGLSHSLGYSNLKVKQKISSRRVGSRISKPVAGSNRIRLSGYRIEVGAEIEFELFVDASVDAPTENIQIYFEKLEIEGSNSDVKKEILPNQDAQDVNGNSGGLNSDTSNGNNNNNNINDSIVDLDRPVLGRINYGFNDSSYPFIDQFSHSGIDYGVVQGTRVRAAAAGTVIESVEPALNNYSYVAIRHSTSMVTIYGHLSQVDVVVGQVLGKGEMIGRSGGTPGTAGAGTYTTGPHLHFELQIDNTPVDPNDYF